MRQLFQDEPHDALGRWPLACTQAGDNSEMSNRSLLNRHALDWLHAVPAVQDASRAFADSDLRGAC